METEYSWRKLVIMKYVKYGEEKPAYLLFYQPELDSSSLIRRERESYRELLSCIGEVSHGRREWYGFSDSEIKTLEGILHIRGIFSRIDKCKNK